MATRTCPWCAEQIQAQAIKCRYCGSRVVGGLRDPSEWHRGHPDRRLAGVCAAVGHHLGVSVTAVRAVFLILALLHGVGFALYAVLWFALPPEPGGRSGLDRVVDAVRTLIGAEPLRDESERARAESRHHHTDGPGGEGSSDRWSPTRN